MPKMPYTYSNRRKFILIVWDWDSEDEFYWEPHEVIPELLKQHKDQLLKDLTVHEDDWMEFVGGMSMMVDKVLKIQLTYEPCSGATMKLWKRLCKKCGKTCGLAEQFCDGTGTPNR